MQSLQIGFGLFLFFVHNFEGGPRTRDCWIRVGPWVHTLLAVFNYLGAPIASFVVFFTYESTASQSIFKVVVSFFSLINLGNLIICYLFVYRLLLAGFNEAAFRTQLRKCQINKPERCNLHDGPGATQFGKDYDKLVDQVKPKCLQANSQFTVEDKTAMQTLSQMRLNEQTCCYDCHIELAKAQWYTTGSGLGRINKPELFGEGLYRLFYLASMRLSYRKEALKLIEGSDEPEVAVNDVEDSDKKSDDKNSDDKLVENIESSEQTPVETEQATLKDIQITLLNKAFS